MIDIAGRWTLVTGASRGVGMRVARALASHGCRLILHSRTLEGTVALVTEMRSAGVTAHAVAGELAESADVDAIIGRVREITGDALEILYNNAAIQARFAEPFSHTAQEYEACFRVNAVAPAKLCDAFLPSMLRRNFGRIVNVTSGIRDQPQLMPYSVSKAALERYVRDFLPTLAGTNVLMNLLDPGWLRTDLGGPNAPNDPDTVLPGALVPVLLDETAGSGKQYNAQDYREK